MRTPSMILPLLEARSGGPAGDVDVFPSLFSEYTAADHATRRLLDRDAAPAARRGRPAGRALRGCPGGLAPRLPDAAGSSMTAVTAAAGHRRSPGGSSSRSLIRTCSPSPPTAWLTAAFEQVSKWRRRDLSALADAL